MVCQVGAVRALPLLKTENRVSGARLVDSGEGRAVFEISRLYRLYPPVIRATILVVGVLSVAQEIDVV
jgi:hypothetical protein